jgi:hypothetical protein
MFAVVETAGSRRLGVGGTFAPEVRCRCGPWDTTDDWRDRSARSGSIRTRPTKSTRSLSARGVNATRPSRGKPFNKDSGGSRAHTKRTSGHPIGKNCPSGSYGRPWRVSVHPNRTCCPVVRRTCPLRGKRACSRGLATADSEGCPLRVRFEVVAGWAPPTPRHRTGHVRFEGGASPDREPPPVRPGLTHRGDASGSRSRRTIRPTVVSGAPRCSASSATVRAPAARATVTRLLTLVLVREVRRAAHRSTPAAHRDREIPRMLERADVGRGKIVRVPS